MTAHARHLSATQTDQDHRVGVPGPPEPAETVSGPSETLDRDVTVMLRRRIRHTLAEQVTADPERTLGKLATLVADELRRTGQAVEAPPREPFLIRILDRLRPLTPNGERVLGWAGGTLALGLLLVMIVRVVQGITG